VCRSLHVGKSTTLRAISHINSNSRTTDNDHKTLYLVFNKSQQIEAEKKGYPDTIVSTIHSFAYQHIKYVMPINLKHIPFKTFKLQLKSNYGISLFGNIGFKAYLLAKTYLDDFYLSKYVSINEFIKDNCSYHPNLLCGSDKSKAEIDFLNNVNSIAISIMKPTLEMIDNCTIPMSHGFYLKKFHMLLDNKDIELNQSFNLCSLDEAHDSSAVTFEILKLLQIPLKVCVGDKYQNIYGFLNTVNILDTSWADHTFKLTNSFRCTPEIGVAVSDFVHEFDETFEFNGVGNNYEDDSVIYLTMTNAGMLAKMIELTKQNKKFSCLRDPETIYAPIFAVQNANNPQKHEKLDSQYKFLIDEYVKWETEYKLEYASFFGYIMGHLGDEYPELKSACKLILEDKDGDLHKLYTHYKTYNAKTATIKISNSFIVKG